MSIEKKNEFIRKVRTDQLVDCSTVKDSCNIKLGKKNNKSLFIIANFLSSFKSILKTFSKFNPYSGQSFFILLTRVFNILKKEGFSGIFNRILLRFYLNGFKINFSYKWQELYLYPVVKKNKPCAFKVSIIVPNYNHAKYLQQRLDSIFNQDYPIYEVILLDDCSTDESRDILISYQNRYPDIVKCYFNSVNSGGVFYQWAKGIELATGDLIWIAESDDYCSLNFLSEMTVPFVDTAVKLAFCRTLFVSNADNKVILRSEDYLRELDINNLNSGKFLVSANALIKKALVVKNVIPNVSSTVFRHPGKISLFTDPVWLSMRLCGDWVFYLVLIRAGLVAYNACAINYYRQHASNTSVMAQKEPIYYKEHYMVREYMEFLYHLMPSDLDRQYNHLYRHWCTHHGFTKKSDFDLTYASSKPQHDIKNLRYLNIAIVTYALAGGGGETFPLMLANLLHRRGHSVIVIDFNQLPPEPGIRAMLDPNIAVLKLNKSILLPTIISDMDIDVIHSHHAFVDMAIAALLKDNVKTKHVVTMHGMYEMFSNKFFSSLKDKLELVDKFVYTADKNLIPFSEEFMTKKSFERINNAVTALPFTPIHRQSLGINDQDFVLCMVARAIPEKGWEEAIEAVCFANKNSDRLIHLLLIGEGVESIRLKSLFTDKKFIHFLGFRSDIRAFFACSDMGFIPSRFKGESFPLVLIDCLLTDRPVLASNVGEISKMLATSNGNAGVVFSLENWQIPVEILADLIRELANNSVLYKQVYQNVHEAAEKFDPEKMVTAYEKAYYDLCC